jgi:hypothetical protein
MKMRFRTLALVAALSLMPAAAIAQESHTNATNTNPVPRLSESDVANMKSPANSSAGVYVPDTSLNPPAPNFNGGGSSGSNGGVKPGQVTSPGWTGSGGLSSRETAPQSTDQNVGSSGVTP